MEFNEMELLGSRYLVRESDDNNEARLRDVGNWRLLYPEVERECNVAQEVSVSRNNQLMTDSVATSIDHDPVATTVVTSCSSCLVSAEDLYQEIDQSGNKLEEKQEEDKGTLATDTKKAERDGGYDPRRIPSSVFERSDSSAQWSGASNESLFSLHGGISFGRDHVLVGSESLKVRELGKLDELKAIPPSASDEADDNEADAKETESIKDKPKEEEGEKAHSSEEEPAKPAPPVIGSSISCRSDASDGSTFSFAFPVLAPGRQQNSSPKGSAYTKHSREPHSDTSHSREPHSEPENFMGTQPQPQPPPSAAKKKRCCFSCLSICSLPSFCSCSFCCRPRCSSCWHFKS